MGSRLKEWMGIDINDIDADYIPGATHYRSPDGDAVWNGVTPRE